MSFFCLPVQRICRECILSGNLLLATLRAISFYQSRYIFGKGHIETLGLNNELLFEFSGNLKGDRSSFSCWMDYRPPRIPFHQTILFTTMAIPKVIRVLAIKGKLEKVILHIARAEITRMTRRSMRKH